MLGYFSWFFSSHLFLMGNLFQFIFIFKRLNFWYSLQMFSIFFVIRCDCCSVLIAFIIISDHIYCCFFFFFSNGDSLYLICHNLNFLFMTFLMQQFTAIKNKVTTFHIDSSLLVWYLERSDSKGSLITHLIYHKTWFIVYHSLNCLQAFHQCN